MKRFVYLFCIFLLVLGLTACDNKKASTEAANPASNINTVYDTYGNILQQSVYNEQTGETTTTIFTYKRVNGLWVCVDQQVIVTGKQHCQQPITLLTLRDNNLPEIILDNQDVTISVVEKLESESWWEFGYKLKIENHSNQAISVLFNDVSIADVSSKPLFNVDQVEPGYTTYFNLAWDRDSLAKDWVPYLNDVQFTLSVYIGTENWKKPADYGLRVLIRD